MTCKEEAISIPSSIPKIDKSKCLLCGQCVKACSQGAMEEGITGYKLLVGGKLGRHPRLATELPGVFQMKEAVDITNRIISYYKENCVKGERFGELLENKKIFDLDQGGRFLNDILY
jgi:dissimilatory sulfite reductase (desulfoviridin) alpha/beta subunit